VLQEIVELLACPHCGGPLGHQNRALVCPAGHSFDIARQGYVSLLAGPRRGITGDTARMVQDRDRFLSAGHFAPLTDALVGLAQAAPEWPVLDIGAGTGHHLEAVLRAQPLRTGIALDASKYAARRAAAAHPRAAAIVADASRPLPVRTASIGLALGVFSPRNGAEVARVLRQAGEYLVVTPNPDHLEELVAGLGLLAVDERKPERLAGALGPYFELEDRTELRWELRLSERDAVAAAGMGPSAHHLDGERLAALVAALPRPVVATASVNIYRCRPHSNRR
jgi:23S rRNA (guanine745-N1)-methyltransferase